MNSQNRMRRMPVRSKKLTHYLRNAITSTPSKPAASAFLELTPPSSSPAATSPPVPYNAPASVGRNNRSTEGPEANESVRAKQRMAIYLMDALTSSTPLCSRKRAASAEPGDLAKRSWEELEKGMRRSEEGIEANKEPDEKSEEAIKTSENIEASKEPEESEAKFHLKQKMIHGLVNSSTPSSIADSLAVTSSPIALSMPTSHQQNSASGIDENGKSRRL